MRKSLLSVAVAALLSVAVSTDASAYVFGGSDPDIGNLVTLNGADRLLWDTGWYNSAGFHDAANTNYIAGAITALDQFRNFFVFELEGISGPVSSASITLQTFDVEPLAGEGSVLEFLLFDVSTDIRELMASHEDGAAGLAIFTDLGTGAGYGGRNYTNADDGTYQTIVLNAAFLADLNAAILAQDVIFAIGGRVASANIPEPATLILFGSGLVGFAVLRRRRKGKA